MKSLTATIARWIYALPFAVFGINHFMHAGMMKGYVPKFIPGGIFWIYFVGLALIAATVSIVTNKMAKLASLLLAIMLGIFVLTIHLPGLANPQTMQMSLVGLLKDTSLAGGALLLYSIFSAEEKENS